MKKALVLLAVSMLSGCYTYYNDDTKPLPRMIVDTPYGMKDLYAETNAPQIYSVIAARATNKMLNQTTDIYEREKAPKIYIRQVKKMGANHVPDGFYYARKTTKEIVARAGAYTVVNTPKEAQYMLDISVSKPNVAGLEGSVLQYKLMLLNKKGKEIGSWIENIRQVQNDDQSWQ